MGRSVLRLQHLRDPCPTFLRLTQIHFDSAGVVVIVGKKATKVFENLHPLELLSVHLGLPFVGLGGCGDCSILGPSGLTLSRQHCLFMTPT